MQCRNCGAHVPYQGRGQPRRYCSAACHTAVKRRLGAERRRRWYRQVADGAITDEFTSAADARQYLTLLAGLSSGRADDD